MYGLQTIYESLQQSTELLQQFSLYFCAYSHNMSLLFDFQLDALMLHAILAPSSQYRSIVPLYAPLIENYNNGTPRTTPSPS